MTGLVSKVEARSRGAKFYYTGKECSRGHLSERYLTGMCVVCAKENSQRQREENPEATRDYAKSYREQNAQRCRDVAKRWRESNQDYLAASKREYARRRPEVGRQSQIKWRSINPEAERAKGKKWALNNSDKRAAGASRRRATQLKATPATFSEFDEFVIQEAHAARLRRQHITGYPWHVDHMIPLARGGQHVFSNIQVIPAFMNSSKGARLVLTKPFEWVSQLPGHQLNNTRR